MEISKNSSRVDLKVIYRNVLNAGMTLSLFIIITLFYSFQSFESTSILPEDMKFTTEIINIPQINQLKQPPPPAKPSVPVPADEDDILDDVTINNNTEINFEDVNDILPPPEPDTEVYTFSKVEQKPVLIHKEVPKYPELARKAGVQGMVVVNVTIDEKGNVEKAEIFKSIPMLDDAALKAAEKCRFKPAKQRDRFVKVTMSIPFTFRLN